MELNDPGGDCPRSAAPENVTGSFLYNNSLSSVLPWEWILENLLDQQELSLPFFKVLIGKIPHIEDPRCSRLLQKVALRYLDEVVVTGRVDVCSIPLVRFILKEQGVSNLQRIYSLRESFENDLLFRIEIEAVLTNLRRNSEEGGGDWEAYDYALENIFPKDTCDPRRVDVRNELLAISLDRFSAEPQKDLSERMLAKYPVQELVKDMVSFIEDKRKSFKIKFLDQLAIDIEKGVHKVSSTAGINAPEVTAHPELHEDIFPNDEGRDVQNRFLEKSVGDPVLSGRVSDVDLEDRRAEDQPGGNHLEPRKHADGHLTRQCEVLKTCSVGNEILIEKHGVTEPTSYGANIGKGVKRVLDASLEHVSCLAKKAKMGRSGGDQRDETKDRSFWEVNIDAVEEGEGLNKLVVDITNDRFSPVIIKNDSGVHSGTRLSIESEDMALTISDDDIPTPRKNGGGYTKRIHLRRMSKDGQATPMKSHGGSGESAVPLAGNQDNGLSPKCFFCERVGDRQMMCQRCRVTVHECCLMELSMGAAAEHSCWYCPSCLDTIAQETLRKAEEELKKAKEEALNSKKRLTAFLSAKGKSSREYFEALHNFAEPKQRTTFTSVVEATKEISPSIRTEQTCVLDHTSDHRSVEKPMSSQLGAGRLLSPTVICPTLAEGPLLHVSLKSQKTSMHSPLKTTFLDERDAAGVSSDGASAEEADRPASAPSLQVDQSRPLGGQKSFRIGGKQPASISPTNGVTPIALGTDKQTRPDGDNGVNEDLGPTKVQTAESEFLESGSGRLERANNQGFTMVNHGGEDREKEQSRADDHTGANEDLGTVKVQTSVSEFLEPGGGRLGPANDLRFIVVNPGGEDGDRHDGDLGEVYDRGKTAVGGDKVMDDIADANISVEPNVAAESSRRHWLNRGRQIPGIRRIRLPWTAVEEDLLKEGVRMFSNGGEWGFHWKRILDFGYGKFHSSRTTVDLKDKWRNMLKSGNIL